MTGPLKSKRPVHSSEHVADQARPARPAKRGRDEAGPPRETKQLLAKLLKPLKRLVRLRREDRTETPGVADPKTFEPSQGAVR